MVRTLDPEKRERILETACTLFIAEGLSVTMGRIASESGVAVGTLYLYFSSKDDLVAGCMHRFDEQHQQIIDDILADDAPADVRARRYLLHRITVNIEVANAGPYAKELTVHVMRLFPNRFDDIGDMLRNTIQAIFEQGVERGELPYLRDPEEAAMVLLYSLAHFFQFATEEYRTEPNMDHVELVLDWHLNAWKHGLAPRP